MNGAFGFWQQIPVQRRKRIVLFTAAVLLVFITLWAARSVLGIYFVGLVLAYLLAPVVDAIQQGIDWLAGKARSRILLRMSRSMSIVISYLMLVAVIVGFFALVVPIVVREGQQLWNARQGIWEQVTRWAEDALAQYELLPDRIRQQIDDALRELSANVTRILEQAVSGTVVAISYTFAIVLAITVIPFWTYFLLRDIDHIRNSIYDSLPASIREDVRSMLRLLDRTVGGYLRGELVLMVLVGILQTIAMSVLGIQYALVLGVIAGVLEIVPNIGPTLAAVPAVLIGLTEGPLLALGAAAAARIVQMIENSFIVPRVLGGTMGLHPVVLMVMLVVGAQIAGLPGLILAPILTAVLRDIYRYLAYRFADDPCTPEEAMARVIRKEVFSVEL